MIVCIHKKKSNNKQRQSFTMTSTIKATETLSFLIIILVLCCCQSFTLRSWSTTSSTARSSSNKDSSLSATRRTVISQILLSSPSLFIMTNYPQNANAGIDPNTLKQYQVEGDISGSQQRLRQLEVEKNRPEDTMNIPFEDLPSGVSYREYREGNGETIVQNGSKVAVEMTIRCKSFATANDPGGLKYFSTKDDTAFNELAWTVGSGELLPGLEEGMMGMHKNAIRRIEIPSTMVFAARKEGQLPLPKESNKDGKRRFENLFKTDATLLFEVLVTRIK